MTTQPEQWKKQLMKLTFDLFLPHIHSDGTFDRAEIELGLQDFISQLLKTQHKQSYAQGVQDSKNVLESYDTWGYEEVARNELDKLLDNLEQ